jgi:hypothetical protein
MQKVVHERKCLGKCSDQSNFSVALAALHGGPLQLGAYQPVHIHPFLIRSYRMKKFLAMLSLITVLAASAAALTPVAVSAAPARPHQGFRCYVQDANFVQYTVPCDYHEVLKTDANGQVVAVLNYQDHAQLPPDAALPTTTLHSILHVDCGCIYDGDYAQTLTPSGEYHSHGPINQ